MNIEKFKLTEKSYNDLKERHSAGEISTDEMKKQLKSLMILDDAGNYWMIGGKSGKWYTYENKEWVESNPYPIEAEAPAKVEEHIDTSDNPFAPSHSEYSIYGDRDDNEHESAQVSYQESEQATTTIDFGSETENQPHEEKEPSFADAYVQNKYEPSPQTRTQSTLIGQNQPITNTINLPPAAPTPAYESHPVQAKEDPPSRIGKPVVKTQTPAEQEIKKMAPPSQVTITQISILHAMAFFGGLGIIIGVIVGAIFGIFEILEPISAIFPMKWIEMRGRVLGGFLFAAIGGVTGFMLTAMCGALYTIFYNTVASVFCGIRIKIKVE